MDFQSKWMDYMLSRRGDYAFRSRTRYAAVADCLFAMGLNDSHVVMDIGAGSCQFFHFLSRERGWTGRIVTVDAVLCGHDLDRWMPRVPVDYIVCIEVLEHLKDPMRMLKIMDAYAKLGAVLTTPNSEVVDVIACDPTHVSEIPPSLLLRQGWTVWTRSFFGKPEDTLVACNKMPYFGTISGEGRKYVENEVTDPTGIGRPSRSGVEALGSGLLDAPANVESRTPRKRGTVTYAIELPKRPVNRAKAEGQQKDRATRSVA